MKKILYYSPVDWNWIKQRPQFIALELAERGFDVCAIYIRQYRKKGLQHIDPEKVKLHPIYRIPPFGYKFPLLNKVNRWIVRHKIAWELRHFQPDILWLTHPSQLEDIPNTFMGQIIYDCMDDYDVLGSGQSSCENIYRQEQALCNRADLVFVSSSILLEKICSRNSDKTDQVHLIRNGCDGKLYPRVTGTHSGKIYAGYVGTIAEWFDFDLIVQSLERIPALEYFLIGPVLVNNPPVHERIHYLGTVAHKDLFDMIKEMDCMVMPFRLVDVVMAVDPVKLYEYISWQKNIITVAYPEIERFDQFVQKYSNMDEYCSAIINLGVCSAVSYSEQDAKCFLADNAWKKRVDSIEKRIREMGISTFS